MGSDPDFHAQVTEPRVLLTAVPGSPSHGMVVPFASVLGINTVFVSCAIDPTSRAPTDLFLLPSLGVVGDSGLVLSSYECLTLIHSMIFLGGLLLV